eukprot:2920209-Amphidinium_carterae.1
MPQLLESWLALGESQVITVRSDIPTLADVNLGMRHVKTSAFSRNQKSFAATQTCVPNLHIDRRVQHQCCITAC